jgi:sirohydrochlorin ferrochelatase
MRGVVLVGHGSLRRGAGAAMIRLAQRLREERVAPVVAAGFLNYSRPSFAEAVARCVARGAREIVVQPYFLVPGVFVANDLPQLVAEAQALHPLVSFEIAAPLGDHPALASLVLRRAEAALVPPIGQAGSRDGLLLMAHGSPDTSTVATIDAVAQRIRQRRPALQVLAGYLDLNAPLIGQAIDQLVAENVTRLVAVPYFLQLGRHVARDLPAILAAARQRHPQLPLCLASHLGYDPLLATVLADRIRAVGAGYRLSEFA